MSGPGRDVLHYCRIPEGQTACADEQSFEPYPDGDPNFDVAGPHVMVTPAGDVILLTNRVGVSVEGSFPNLVYTSSEHGAPGTFSMT